jgi:hypothetical protein
MLRFRRDIGVFVASLLLCSSCTSSHNRATIQAAAAHSDLVQKQYGVACSAYHALDTPWNTRPSPLSYAVSDLGKPGVPKFTARESAVLTRIQRYVHSETLRFAWVYGWKPHDFIVYDATDGPCADFALGYEVLDGPCDVFYEPGENPYQTHPGPPEGITCKRPWGTATGD